MSSNASGVYRYFYSPCIQYSDICFNLKKHMSWYQFRSGQEKNEENIFEKDNGQLVSEKRTQIVGSVRAQTLCSY